MVSCTKNKTMHMASMRESETFDQTVQRKERDRVHKANMGESETFEQTVHRQEQNRMRMASMRESETFEQTVQRKEGDRMHQSNLRGFICQQTIKEYCLPSFLHRRQCHCCTVDAGAGHGSIHIYILYLLMTPFFSHSNSTPTCSALSYYSYC